MITTTIAAISTPHGKGGVAMVRISGSETVQVLDRCFKAANQKPASERQPRVEYYGMITSPEGETIDSGMAVWYQGPKSYTGEDMAEITCHGGVAVTEAVLAAVFSSGAIPAGPGEFTRRAFSSGKLTLSEAEAVGLLIDADTESRRKLSSTVSRGGLSRKIDEISERLKDHLTALWAAIDYPEEEVGEEGFEKMEETILQSKEGIQNLLNTYKAGHAVFAGVPTVICGSPNVGKSTLYNALCGEEKAIVTSVPGTTRDILETTVDIAGVTLRLYDTAGLHESNDYVERIGIERAKSVVTKAELILGVIDSTRSEEELQKDLDQLIAIKEMVSGASFIVIVNKCDKQVSLPLKVKEQLQEFGNESISLSAVSGEGMEQLEKAIQVLYETDRINNSDGAVVWNAAQKATLEKTLDYLREAEEGILNGAPVDVLGVLCESALATLLQTDGRGISDEIIDQIFARFCVGK